MSYETKDFFNATIKEIYQQTGAILSLENRSERQLLINSLKIFESRVIYNWQKIVYPILNGPKGSPYQKYSGMRSKPWAEFDSLDTVYGGLSGWTVTAEPWATSDGMPCLWDEVNNQPHSITGALYCLSNRIEELSMIQEDKSSDTYDDTDLKSKIYCLENNLTTVYKDLYGCGYTLDCDAEKQKQYSIYTHLYQIFNQLIDGAPTLSVDTSCEDPYPTMSIYMPVSNLTYDISIPAINISGCSGPSIVDDFQAIYDFIGMDDCGSTPVYGTQIELCYVNNGEPLDVSIWRLDQAICNLNTNVTNITPVNLQMAYDNGDAANTYPGEISLSTPTLGSGGGGVNITVPVRNGVVSDYLFNVQDLYRSGFTNENCFRDGNLLTVGEHEVYRKAAKDNALNLIQPLLADFEYPNVHFHKSILTLEPTAGIPHTRGYQSADYNGAAVDKDTAIWVSSGKLRDCSDNTTVYDCDGNLVGGDNLYFRHPNSGYIFKLNKCGGTIGKKKSDGGDATSGVDYPVGGLPREYSAGSSGDDYIPSTTVFQNPDNNGLTVGWQSTDTAAVTNAVTEATLTVSEITADNIGAAMDIRTIGATSVGKLRWAHGQLGATTELASIDIGNATNDLKIQAIGSRSLGLWTDSSQRLHVTSDGKIGMGTSTPAQSLHLETPNDGEGILVRNLSTGGAFEAKYIAGADYGYQLKLDDNNNATTVFIRSYGDSYFNTGGNFGIGTSTPGAKLDVNGDVIVSENLRSHGNVIVDGDLIVNGTTTTINSTTLDVDDKNIVLGNVDTPSNTTADGGGITLKATVDKEFKWVSGTDRWTSNVGIDANGNIEASSGSNSLTLDVSGVNSGNAGLWSDGSHLVLGSKTNNDLNIFLNDTETLQITKGNGVVKYTSHGGTGDHDFIGSVGVGVLAPTEKLDVDGGIRVGNSTGTNVGTIRWDGSDLEVYKGAGPGWTSLTASGGSGTVTSITTNADNGAGTAITTAGTFTFTGGTNVTTSVSGTVVTINATDTNTQLSQEQVEDIAGPLVATGGVKTGIAVTYDDANNNMDFVVSDLTVSGDTGSTGMTPGDTLTITGGANVATSMSGDELTITATNTQLSNEQVHDIAGPLVATGGTKTGITITYDDVNNDMDFVVSDTTFTSDSGSAAVTPGSTLNIEGGTNCTTSVTGNTLTINATTAAARTFGSISVDVFTSGSAQGKNVHGEGLNVFNETEILISRSNAEAGDSKIQFNVDKGYAIGDVIYITNTTSEVDILFQAVQTDTYNNSPTLVEKFQGYHTATSVDIGGGNFVEECQFGAVGTSLDGYDLLKISGGSRVRMVCTAVNSGTATFDIFKTA